MEGEGHEPSACQEHKSLLEYSRTFFPILPHSSPGRSKSYSWGRASKFQFCEQLFSISFFLFFFFFFNFSNHICFSPVESTHTHLALAFRHTVLTKTRKQLLPSSPPQLPELGVWVTLENLEGKKKVVVGEGGVFQNSPQHLHNTESMPLAPGSTSNGPGCELSGQRAVLAAGRHEKGK